MTMLDGPFTRPSRCELCEHFDVMAINSYRCAAFPEGIPLSIWNGTNPHDIAIPGDHGFQYQPLTEETRQRQLVMLDEVVRKRRLWLEEQLAKRAADAQ